MKAINASIMRAANRKMLLDAIRRHPISRAELSDVTGLTRASVTQIIDDLMADGLVKETAVVGRNRLGRRNMQLALCPEARILFGVHLSRLRCDVGAIDLSGQVLARESRPLEGCPPEEILSFAARAILQMRDALEISDTMLGGAGCCAPGPLNAAEGMILNPPNFEIWHNVKVVQRLQALTGLTLTLDNVANAHALNERYFGVAREANNFVLLRVDEGVGSGTVINGRLFHGARGFAAEYGHVSVDMNGPVCNCGNRGCLEKYIRIPTILEGSAYRTWEQVTLDAGQSPQADEIIGRMAEYLAFAVVNIINSLDVEKVILAGDLAVNPDRLVSEVNRRVAHRIIFPMQALPVLAGSIADPVRLAAMPALNQFFASDFTPNQ